MKKILTILTFLVLSPIAHAANYGVTWTATTTSNPMAFPSKINGVTPNLQIGNDMFLYSNNGAATFANGQAKINSDGSLNLFSGQVNLHLFFGNVFFDEIASGPSSGAALNLQGGGGDYWELQGGSSGSGSTGLTLYGWGNGPNINTGNIPIRVFPSSNSPGQENVILGRGTQSGGIPSDASGCSNQNDTGNAVQLVSGIQNESTCVYDRLDFGDVGFNGGTYPGLIPTDIQGSGTLVINGALVALNNIVDGNVVSCSGGSTALQTDGLGTLQCGTVTSSVTSVNPGSSAITVSPTTGSVFVTLNLANSNTWTAASTKFNNNLFAALTGGSVMSVGSTSPIATFTIQPHNVGNSMVGSSSIIVASTTGMTEFQMDQWGHRMSGGLTPSCGAGCSSVSGDDMNFRAVTGTGVTAVTVNFTHAWVNPSGNNITPVCVASDESGGTTVSDASSTPTSVTMNLSASLTTKNLAVHCEASINFTN